MQLLNTKIILGLGATVLVIISVAYLCTRSTDTRLSGDSNGFSRSNSLFDPRVIVVQANHVKKPEINAPSKDFEAKVGSMVASFPETFRKYRIGTILFYSLASAFVLFILYHLVMAYMNSKNTGLLEAEIELEHEAPKEQDQSRSVLYSLLAFSGAGLLVLMTSLGFLKIVSGYSVPVLLRKAVDRLTTVLLVMSAITLSIFYTALLVYLLLNGHYLYALYATVGGVAVSGFYYIFRYLTTESSATDRSTEKQPDERELQETPGVAKAETSADDDSSDDQTVELTEIVIE